MKLLETIRQEASELYEKVDWWWFEKAFSRLMIEAAHIRRRWKWGE